MVAKMKTRFTVTAILLLTFVAAAAAQNRVKLFEQINITISDPVLIWNAVPWGSYKSAEVYLSCQSNVAPTSIVTGPNGGGFVVDNVLVINNRNACGGFCFWTTANPYNFIGQPVESAYAPVGPFNEDHIITGSGYYKFYLMDIGHTYGNTAIYLNTSCQITPIDVPPQDEEGGVICHRNNGTRGQRTITVGSDALPAHLAHGDTLGPCQE